LPPSLKQTLDAEKVGCKRTDWHQNRFNLLLAERAIELASRGTDVAKPSDELP
jgi:hypothetical protein